MSLIQKIVAILIALISFGECVHVLLGDPVTFPETENCPIKKSGKLSRVAEHGTSPVADWKQGVWTPVGDYKNRGIQSASFAFNSTVYTDTGLYEFECGSRVQPIHLSVVIGLEASVREGAPVKLMCYITDQRVDSIRWEKGPDTVLELNMSSGESKHGPAYDVTVSLSPDGKLGDYSLIINQVQSEHEGDYFCSTRTNGARHLWGDPAAVRLRVTKSSDRTTVTEVMEDVGSASSNETTKILEEEQMGTWAIFFITAAVMFVIVAPSCFLFGRYLKTPCSRTKTTSCGEELANKQWPALLPPKEPMSSQV